MIAAPLGVFSTSIGLGWQLAPVNGGGAMLWPSANLAIFVPFTAQETTVIRKLSYRISAGASGNGDVGVYARTGTRLVSTGSHALAGSGIIVKDPGADTLLVPEHYWLALALDTTAVTMNGVISSGGAQLVSLLARHAGAVQMASAFPLPATMTPVALTSDFCPYLTAYGAGFV